jgi:hypothetical protein
VILQIAASDDPPLRLLLGSDAVEGVEKTDRAKTESDQKWRSLSLSTDFGPANDSAGNQGLTC